MHLRVDNNNNCQYNSYCSYSFSSLIIYCPIDHNNIAKFQMHFLPEYFFNSFGRVTDAFQFLYNYIYSTEQIVIIKFAFFFCFHFNFNQ